MDARYFSQAEYKDYFEKEYLKIDIKNQHSIGISSISEFFFTLERFKKQHHTPETLKSFMEIANYLHDMGFSYICNIDSECIYENAEDDDFFESFLNKRTDPFLLAMIFSLRPRACSFWTEDVVIEAINQNG